VTVKPSGGDYPSLNSAEAGEQGNLVTLDRQLDVAWYSMDDTTRCVFSGWTTDATRYVRVYTPPTERHDGKWNAAKQRYRVTSGWGGFFNGLDCQIPFTRFEGLQISGEPDTTGNDRVAIAGVGDGGWIKDCIVRIVPPGTPGTGYSGIQATHSNAHSYVVNCVVYTTGGTPLAASNGISFGTGNFTYNGYAYSNTVYGWGTGITKTAGNALVAKNNLCNGNTTDYGGSPYAASSVTNLSEDTSSPNTALRSKAVTFVDEAGFDFHLSPSDANAKGAGTDLSADAAFPFSTDIDGQTRAAPWDAGADQLAAATLTQSGHRFRADDGSESGATWLGAEGGGVTRPAGQTVRLRAQVDAGGDPAAAQFRLEYRVNGGPWQPAGP
jgi:hypothetical protein